jgi:hypothetical protein
MVKGLRHLVAGIAAALHDETDEAVTHMRAGVEIWSRVASGMNLAGARAIFSYLLGDDHPEAAAAGAQARAFLMECGAHRLLDVWAGGLPASEGTRRVG